MREKGPDGPGWNRSPLQIGLSRCRGRHRAGLLSLVHETGAHEEDGREHAEASPTNTASPSSPWVPARARQGVKGAAQVPHRIHHLFQAHLRGVDFLSTGHPLEAQAPRPLPSRAGRLQPQRRASRRPGAVIELGLVGADARIDVGRDRDVPLADEFAEPRPRQALEVEQADSPMPQVVRRPQGSPAARHALAVEVRSASAPDPAKSGAPLTDSPSPPLEKSSRCRFRHSLYAGQGDERRPGVSAPHRVICAQRASNEPRGHR